MEHWEAERAALRAALRTLALDYASLDHQLTAEFSGNPRQDQENLWHKIDREINPLLSTPLTRSEVGW